MTRNSPAGPGAEFWRPVGDFNGLGAKNCHREWGPDLEGAPRVDGTVIASEARRASAAERQTSAFAAIGDSARSGLPDRPASPRVKPAGPRDDASPPWRLPRFGFSWLAAVSLRSPRREVLDSLGFPWILSSESRLFNGLRGLFAGGLFRAPGSPRCQPRHDGGPRSRHVERRGCSWAETLPIFLIFCKYLLSRHCRFS